MRRGGVGIATRWCGWCGVPVRQVEHVGDGTGAGDTPSPWPGKELRGQRALYFNLEHDADLCGATCSSWWHGET